MNISIFIILRDMNEEYKMVIANEDLVMLLLGTIAFILAFVDLSQSAFSFPSLLLFLLGWGIERFRRRPLPKQVLKAKLFYLAPVKIIRNYVLYQIILLNGLYLFGFEKSSFEIRTGLIFLYLALIIVSIVELAGNVRIPDNLVIIPEIETESEEVKKKKRFQVLYGAKFITWIIFSSLISIGILSLSIISIVNSNSIVVIILSFLILLPAGVTYYYHYYEAIVKEHSLDVDYLLKATDYYVESELPKLAYELLYNFLEKEPNNIVALGKLALLYLKDGNYKKVLETTGKSLAYIEEEKLDVPHTKSRMYVFRALSQKALGKYEEAYKSVNKALTINPDNMVARKLRRELRAIVKKKEIDSNQK